MEISPSPGSWHAAGISVRGASHVRSDLENQDRIELLPPNGIGARVAISVADGHGSPKSFRSARGAQLAIEVSNALAKVLLISDITGPAFIKARLDHDVPRRVVREWRARVEEDLSGSPISETELGLLEERSGAPARRQVESDPYLAYGTTLITAVATESYVALWQIGDGDVVFASTADDVARPLGHDERLLGNETTSLCSTDAWQLFRVFLTTIPPPLILLSTDGLANSFVDDAGFFKFGSDLLRMIGTEGLGVVDGRLDGWLHEMTERGSGDDISLGILCRPEALPPPESVEDMKRSATDSREAPANDDAATERPSLWVVAPVAPRDP